MASVATTSPMDAFGRLIRDLRISVTDRCNFRCVYCMPREIFGPGYAFVPRDELLCLEEIVRIAKVFAACGVKKIRITGGEPMIRKNLEHLIEMIAAIEGIDDISMTTNASYLSKDRAVALKDAGLNRITVSLDALDEKTFRRVCDVEFPVSRVLEGIENARQAGFENIKINAVIKRGLNEHSVLPLARYFHGTGSILRFIEYMDVGSTNNWKLDEVVSATELIALINQEISINPVSPNCLAELIINRFFHFHVHIEIKFNHCRMGLSESPDQQILQQMTKQTDTYKRKPTKNLLTECDEARFSTLAESSVV